MGLARPLEDECEGTVADSLAGFGPYACLGALQAARQAAAAADARSNGQERTNHI